MLRKMGLSSFRAFSNASSPHGYLAVSELSRSMIPVHRVVCVLQEVRTRLLCKAVGGRRARPARMHGSATRTGPCDDRRI